MVKQARLGSRVVGAVVLVGQRLRWLARSDGNTVRAAWWSCRAVLQVRRDLAREGSTAQVAPPPPLPAPAGRGVTAVMRWMKPSCLEEALVLQSWMAAHGDRREVVIGVAREDGITAHAWVDGSNTAAPSTYDELHRLPAR